MSPYLPPEILDLILDCLYDNRTTLEACCLVSKSWIPRARRHIFALVRFGPLGRSIASWIETFPDPSDSPAHHTRRLLISGPSVFPAMSMPQMTWIHTFSHIVNLTIYDTALKDRRLSLPQLRGFSPSLRHLGLFCFSLPASEITDFVCSFSLLEDFTLRTTITANDAGGWSAPSTSPKLTGSLHLHGNAHPFMRQLLDLPDGVHFSRINIWSSEADPNLVSTLVSRCSAKLEYFSIRYTARSDMPREMPPLRLSDAAKLKDVDFGWDNSDVRWIVKSLHSATSTNIENISIKLNARAVFADPVEETTHRGWRDLDRLLIQLWTSRSVVPRITFAKTRRRRQRNDLGQLAPNLLPGLADRGLKVVCR